MTKTALQVGTHLPDTVIDYDGDLNGPHAHAVFNTARTHRYIMSRTWNSSLPVCNFLMLNPSTADAFCLDPTCSRAVSRAKTTGHGALIVTNLLALRATDPEVMKKHAEPVGQYNDQAIVDAALCATQTNGTVVVAWGTHGDHLGRARHVLQLLEHIGIASAVVRIGPPTKHGHPRHPLYLKEDLMLERHSC